MIYLPKNAQIAKQNDDIPQLISMSTLSREARSEHIVYSWDNETLSSDSKARMRANNDYSYINKGLFKKVYRTKGVPLTYAYEDKHGDIKSYFIYKHINAWGDSFRANELHDHAKKSDIDNGFLKTEFEKPTCPIPSPSYKMLKITIGSFHVFCKIIILSWYLRVKTRFPGISLLGVSICKKLNSS